MVGTEHAKKCLGVHGARPDLGIERLLHDAASRGPEFRQLEDQTLKRHRQVRTEMSRRSTLAADFRSFSEVHAQSVSLDALASQLSQRPRAQTSRCIAIARDATLELASAASRHSKRQRTAAAPRQERARQSARIGYALEPQQPELEIARQRIDRNPDGHGLDDRCAEAEQRLVRVVLWRPLVDQLGKVPDIARAHRRRAAVNGDRVGATSCRNTRSRRSRSR